MALENIKFNLKIFSIDKLYYEFQGKNNDEIIDIIKENHKNQIHAKQTDFSIVKPSLESFETGDFKFYTYCYNQPKNQNYWKLFLPEELIKEQNFDVLEFSFVLFIIYKSNIYCVIGGSGINVIKKFIDPYFGIDLYQYFAKPNDDISLVMNTRGVTGNLSERSDTYNYNQSVNDSLDYSEIPKKIKIIVRKDLREGIFKKYKLSNDMAIMEIGSYFCLKKKLNFEELKQLIVDIHAIKQDNSNYTQLSLFNKVSDEKLLIELDNYLKDRIVEDILLHSNNNKLYLLNDDIIELVNNNKIEKFYECDKFKIRFKKKRKVNDQVINDRNNLYYECTRFIYNDIDNINDRFKIKTDLLRLSITGIINEKESTFGTFYSHINAEIPYQNKKYFRIDNQWFYLENKFIEQIKKEAINYFQLYKLEEKILNAWHEDLDEDSYNKSHNHQNYYVFDKVIKENIELCDILYINEDNLYLIHVKDEFNTQMRNLSSQIILSAKRLWNDLNNISGSNYFIKTIELYNLRNPKNKLDAQDLFDKISKNKLKVNFVMAYNNRAYKNKTSIEKIEVSESSIAKFSVVQTIKEILVFKRFLIKIIDISEIK